jgi:RNA polymerase sigma factor (sigma-70 family)
MATASFGILLRHIRSMAAGGETDRQLLDDFAARHDEAAFAALVARHGPMVLRVCRCVLNHEQDAEDAFQATFLVLARNVGSIRKREAVANWLHGVAHRTALKAKRSAARRRNHEAQLRDQRAWLPCDRPGRSPTWEEVQAVLDEEIERLSETLRPAFVLCILQGKSGAEAAAELGVTHGTLKSRLNRARQRLQDRLARRGIKLSVLLAALSVAEHAVQAGISSILARATARSGLLIAAGGPAAGIIPPHVAALATGVTRTMFLTKARIAAALLLAFGFIVVTGALGLPGNAADENVKGSPDLPAAKSPAARGQERAISYSGRVLGPDGRPVAGAKVYLTKSWRYVERSGEATVYAITADDGTFLFSVPDSLVAKEHLEQLVVTAKGFGPAWTDYSTRPQREDRTLQLVHDQAITGQIVDLQGKPVQGLTVRLVSIKATVGEDLGPWFQDVKAKNGLSWELEARHLKRGLPCAEFPTLPRKTVTDRDGRFRIDGIGRERVALLRLEAPGIATAKLAVLTRPSEPVVVRHRVAEPELGMPADTDTYRGTSFRYVASPSKPIVGTVRDRDTKKPLAGVTIRRFDGEMLPDQFIQTKTDAQGRYQLDGLDKGKGNKIIAQPTDDQPYLMVHADVPDTSGLEPVTVDFDLKRGVWIEGKITDKATRKPVPGQVEYFASRGNRNIADHPGYAGTFTGLFQNRPVLIDRKDGSYRIVGLPGPGVLLVHAFEDYLRATEREDAEGTKDEHVAAEPCWVLPVNYHAVARIDPPKNAERSSRDATLDPGEALTGTVIGVDGKPLAGARAYGLLTGRGGSSLLESAAFTVRGYNRNRPRFVLFVHPEKKLMGVLMSPKNKTDPITIAMQPGTSAKGRLVDEEGRPRPGVTFQVTFRQPSSDHWISHLPHEITTDSNGGFRLETLLPGCRVELRDSKGNFEFNAATSPGETKDLGDVRLKLTNE